MSARAERVSEASANGTMHPIATQPIRRDRNLTRAGDETAVVVDTAAARKLGCRSGGRRDVIDHLFESCPREGVVDKKGSVTPSADSTIHSRWIRWQQKNL